MNLLAIDTASTLCAACVIDAASGAEEGRAVRDLGKGHAEHLAAVAADALAQAGIGYADLGRIAVSVGPGSFTGVRVGVAFARGLALALKVPATGVTTLEALAAEARATFGARPVLAAIDAGRGEINAALYDELGTSLYGPAVTTLSDAAMLAADRAPVLAGTAALAVADAAGGTFAIGPQAATADVAVYARLAAARPPDGTRPSPLYLRAADAKPQAGFVLPRRQD